MASSKEYLEFILGKLSELEEITYRAVMISKQNTGGNKSGY